jgi:hypothetical protein
LAVVVHCDIFVGLKPDLQVLYMRRLGDL